MARDLFFCGICDDVFFKKGNLRTHFLTQAGQQHPFARSVCDKGFIYTGNLKQHIERHSAEKQQICRESGKIFISSTCFQKHAVCHCAKKNSL